MKKSGEILVDKIDGHFAGITPMADLYFRAFSTEFSTTLKLRPKPCFEPTPERFVPCNMDLVTEFSTI